ncbi:MAG: TenA family protein [Microbacteriaceae bacterium]|nr:TenA family protein [Microbacteriaceae bacterium]
MSFRASELFDHPTTEPPAGAVFGPVTAESITAGWWDAIEPVRSRIDVLPFVRGLGDGTLDLPTFGTYLVQDALYLRDYSRVLARASQLAPTTGEQAFWADCASGAITAEMELHRTWIAAHVVVGAEAEPVAATTAYLNHLLATTVSAPYEVVIAALLPCFWIYQDLGERLQARSHPRHPFAAWLGTYADPAFARSTEHAIVLVGAAAEVASPVERERMRRAFLTSSDHEESFFAAHGGK